MFTLASASGRWRIDKIGTARQLQVLFQTSVLDPNGLPPSSLSPAWPHGALAWKE
jgi:hypothetical protein